jgi:hypothetical protein
MGSECKSGRWAVREQRPPRASHSRRPAGDPKINKLIPYLEQIARKPADRQGCAATNYNKIAKSQISTANCEGKTIFDSILLNL